MNLFSKVTLLLVFLMCCCTVLLLAQVPRSNRKLADQYFLAYEFNKALPLYLQLVDTEKPLFTDLERIAKMYQQMNQYEAAENWFVRVVDHPEARSEDLINYGKILKSNGKYVEAKGFLKDMRIKPIIGAK